MMDLHMHSWFSDDGEYTPRQLVEQCVRQGITVMSITDHNSVRANMEAENAVKEWGIRYIPGIEIDCTYMGTEFHVLGYGVDYQSQEFFEIEENVISQRKKASWEMLRKTQELGFDITAEEVFEVSWHAYRPEIWNGDMFAEVLLAKEEYKNHPLLMPYRPGGSRSDNPFVNFYWDFYAQGKPCYTEIKYPMVEDVIEIIHRNHGLAVLAHPGVNLSGKDQLLDPLLELGLDGIEVFSSYHTSKQAAYYYRVACERNLLVTCGSDYHGKTKPSVKLGGLKYLPDVDLPKHEKVFLEMLMD